MSRPFMMEPIEKLEAEFRARQKDSAFLQRLLNELSFRATKRAAQLRADAERALLALAPAKPSMTPAPKPAATVVPFPTSSSKVPSPPPQPQVRPAQRATAAPITNQPDRILSAWTALEVLSPSSYVRPEDLAGGRRINVARLDAGPLPWEGAGQKSKRDHQLYYQLVLGSIDMNLALQQVMVCIVAQYLTLLQTFRNEWQSLLCPDSLWPNNFVSTRSESKWGHEHRV